MNDKLSRYNIEVEHDACILFYQQCNSNYICLST